MVNDFEAWTTDELYLLRLDVAAVLRKKLVIKKNALEERLQQLHLPNDHAIMQSPRHHLTAEAKFRNPDQPSEIWSGHGKRRAG
jgi:DNA-binding protein H-NS